MRRFAEAQSRLTAAIIPLQRLQEAYPDLKTNQNFVTLIASSKAPRTGSPSPSRDYNKAVQAYNTRIRTFPDVIGAKVIYGAEPMVPFQATTPNAEAAPKVDFGNGQ